MAGAVESHRTGYTGIAEPLLKGNAGAGIAREAENKVRRPLPEPFRQEERRFRAQWQVKHLPCLDHALLYLKACSAGADVSPDQGGYVAPPQAAEAGKQECPGYVSS